MIASSSPILTLNKKEEKRCCPPLSVLPQDMREAGDVVPESRWSRSWVPPPRDIDVEDVRGHGQAAAAGPFLPKMGRGHVTARPSRPVLPGLRAFAWALFPSWMPPHTPTPTAGTRRVNGSKPFTAFTGSCNVVHKGSKGLRRGGTLGWQVLS